MEEVLVGKVAVVMGADTPLGERAARSMAARGADVMLLGERAAVLAALAEDIGRLGGAASFRACHPAQAAEAERCIQAAVERFGRIDALVLCSRQVEDSDEVAGCCDEWLQDWARGTCALVRRTLPELQASRGSVIALWPAATPGDPISGAHDRWVRAFLRGLAVGQAKYAVRANGVCIAAEGEARASGEVVLGATWQADDELEILVDLLIAERSSQVTGALYSARPSQPVGKDVDGVCAA